MPLGSLPPAPPGPIRLGSNTPHRFYRGGARILAFRGLDVPDGFDGYRPEDWLASTTGLFAEGGGGQTVLPDGTGLAAALAVDPIGWLGADHVARYGPEPGLLTKLLDAGERLPVHSHPDRTFAARHLHCAHGKTEAWIVLDAEAGAAVWLGFRERIATDRLAELVEAQDERLLGALNRIEVTRGDTVLVPAGQPHAIGAGVLILELQEPTDLSVMLEHERFGLEQAHAFLGLPRSVALDSVERDPLDHAALAGLRRRWTDLVARGSAAADVAGTGSGPDVAGTGSALPPEAAEFFRAEVVRPVGEPVTLEPGFAVTVVVEGAGTITSAAADGGAAAAADPLPVRAGDVLLIPHAAGRVRVAGDVTVIRCRPPGTIPQKDQSAAPRRTPEPTRPASPRRDGGRQ